MGRNLRRAWRRAARSPAPARATRPLLRARLLPMLDVVVVARAACLSAVVQDRRGGTHVDERESIDRRPNLTPRCGSRADDEQRRVCETGNDARVADGDDP